MEDVLHDVAAATEAIPELGRDWPERRLKALGLEVKGLYPELAKWPTHLAAEGHLYYAGRFPCDPSKVQDRSTDFLVFLRATVASRVQPSSAAEPQSAGPRA